LNPPLNLGIEESIVFYGPSRWSSRPVVLLQSNTSASEHQVTRLVQWIQRLQLIGGCQVDQLKVSIDEQADQVLIPIEFEELELTRFCIQLAERWVAEGKSPNDPLAFTDERKIVDLADDLRLGPSSRAILGSARKRGIPYVRLNEGSLVQLGEGIHQRRIWTAETDATSAIAEAIASNKQLTRSLLNAVGVPVPQGRLVADREDAWQAAAEIGLPVAVKPCDANHARGVSLELNDREAVMAAYDWAVTDGQTKKIMVEQFILGEHHRILVVGGKMVAAARGQREYIVGDGQRTVASLVAELNCDARRGENYTDPLGVVPLDEAASIVLAKQGITFDSVPANAQKVLVKHVGDLVEDCTAMVHSETVEAAVLAARVVGLDIAGIDFVVQDISQSLVGQRGGIVEVNAGPSLTPHVKPLRGQPQPVGDAIIAELFTGNTPACIDAVVVLSKTGCSKVTPAIAAKMRQMKILFGMKTGGRVEVNGQALKPRGSDLEIVRGILIHPNLEAILIELSIDDVLRSGFPIQRADCIVLTEEILPDLLEASEAASKPTPLLQAIANLARRQSRIVLSKARLPDNLQVGEDAIFSPAQFDFAPNDDTAVTRAIALWPNGTE
jgi:cyanophycin synthetase